MTVTIGHAGERERFIEKVFTKNRRKQHFVFLHCLLPSTMAVCIRRSACAALFRAPRTSL